jgi:ElaB/YqjD/DUF883 family membrane-anchored ribosome-binding protein
MSDHENNSTKNGIKSGVIGAGIAGAGVAGAAIYTTEELIERLNVTGGELTESLSGQYETFQGQLEARMTELSETLAAQMESSVESSLQTLNETNEELRNEMMATARDAMTQAVNEGREEMTAAVRDMQEELNHVAQQIEYATREQTDRAVAELTSFRDELDRFIADARGQIEQEVDKVRGLAENACNDLERDCGVYKENLEGISQNIQEQIQTVAESALSQMQGSVIVDESGRSGGGDVEFS